MKSKLLVAIIVALLFISSSCKKDESLPSLENIIIGTIPADKETFIAVDSDIKVLIKQFEHTHSNDNGTYTFEFGINLSGIDYGLTTYVKGEGVDTLVFTPEKSLTKQSAFEINTELFWNGDGPPAEGFVYHKTTFTTQPFNLPSSAVNTLYPENYGRNISTYCQPAISFIYPIDKEFSVNQNTYKYVVNEIRLTKDEQEITGSLNWNENKTEVLFIPENELAVWTEYTILVNTQLLVKENGSWHEANEVEIIENSFATVEAESTLLLSDEDIEFAYPASRQYNFHKDEHPTGYLKPKTSYSWMNQENVLYRVLFSDANNSYGPFLASYNTDKRWIEFDLQDFMDNNTIYKMQLIRNHDSQEDTIYTMHFKTSMYSTFGDKIDAFSIQTNGIIDTDYNGVFELKAYLTGEEYFDDYELSAIEYQYDGSSFFNHNGLIQVEADTNNLWYQNYLKPFYQPVLKNQLEISYRNQNELGIIPTELCYFSNDTKLLTDQEISNNEAIGFIIEGYEESKIIYQFSHMSYLDYYDLQTQITDLPENQWTPETEYIWNNDHPSILSGHYYIDRNFLIKAKVKYVIPGVNEITTEKEITVLE